MGAHGLTGLFPDSEKCALTLMVAGPIFMGFAEVAKGDRPVNSGEDLREPNLAWIPGEHITTSDTAF